MALLRCRPAVMRFARQMEAKLRENDDRSGWGVCADYYLLERAAQEYHELCRAIYSRQCPAKVISEAADLANFAMMLADNRIPHSDGKGK